MRRPVFPSEMLPRLLARRERLRAVGIEPSGKPDIDRTRMAHALGLKKRSLTEILDDHKQHDWQGTLQALGTGERKR